ncbi:MAG: iron-sulfur cluster-binding domain-containing protein [Candidatus Lokiarchaeota archaeon]|nr:iron-sulfur cluster-binding domain-containing protein [Candidatus Lokiarchaeota archaeon]
MFKDLKKFTYAQKLKEWREKVLEVPEYFDGMENLHDNIHPGKLWLQISDIQNLSHDTKLYRLIPAKSTKILPPFRAGQYIGLTVEINGVRTARPYSLVSSPNQHAYYELCIRKKEDGFVSVYFYNNSDIGDIVECTEPLGTFYHNSLFHGENLVFIAGGCGITPFISMLRDISERMLPINIWVLFGCLTEGDIIFRQELEDIKNRRSNVKVQYVLSEADSGWEGECGFITQDIIKKVIGDVKGKYFYVVGNRDMYQFVFKELEDLGVPKHRITYEAYGNPDDVVKVIGWPSNLNSSNNVEITIRYIEMNQVKEESFEAPCVEPILNSIERNFSSKLKIESGCRSGACALCRTKLISGKIFMPPEVTIREVDQKFGYIHPCISYPLTNLTLDLM